MSYTYKKSSVIGGSWSTPFGTPFFIRWGEWSLKVPMANLRQEYEAWEKLQRRPEPEPPKPDPFPSFPSGPFNWAEDVEQEFFSGAGSNDSDNSTGNTDIKLDSKPDTDSVDAPIVDQVVPEGVAVVGAGTTLCAIPEEDEEEGVTGEDEAADLDSIDLTDSDSTPPADSTDSTDSDSTLADSDSTPLDGPTPLDDPAHLDDSTPLDDPTPLAASTSSTDIDTTIYRIVNVSATNTDLSLHMVEDDTASDTSNPNSDATDTKTTAQELFEAIQFLAGVGLLNLDTYATVFDTAARACAAGPPFWLNDPVGDREIAV